MARGLQPGFAVGVCSWGLQVRAAACWLTGCAEAHGPCRAKGCAHRLAQQRRSSARECRGRGQLETLMSSSLRRSDICLTEGCAVWPGRLHLAVLWLGAAAGGRAAAHPHGARAGGPRLEAGASVALSEPTRHMRGVASAACRGACVRCGACALGLFSCDTHHARAGAPRTCWVAALKRCTGWLRCLCMPPVVTGLDQHLHSPAGVRRDRVRVQPLVGV